MSLWGDESRTARGQEIRFLHTGDWQIGQSFVEFPPERRQALQEARFHAVRRLAEKAHEHRVHFVLVAGDVFENDAVPLNAIEHLLHVLEAFAPVPVYIVPGNHDAVNTYLYQSSTFRTRCPNHVHVFLEPGIHRVGPQGQVALVVAPVVQRDLPPVFPSTAVPEGVQFRVVFTHGTLEGTVSPQNPSPLWIPRRDLDAWNAQYIALGHYHGWRRYGRAVYPGTPEPTKFDEREAGFAALVTLRTPEEEPEVEKLPVGQYRWQAKVYETHTLREAVAFLEELAQNPELTPHTLLRIHLAVREHDPMLIPSLKEAQARLEQRVFHLDLRTQFLRQALPPDFDEQVSQRFPMGEQLLEHLRRLKARLEEDEAEGHQGGAAFRLDRPRLDFLPPQPDREVIEEALRELEQWFLKHLQEERR